MKLTQKQNRSLLEEHAHSSFNLTFIGRNELFIAIGFFLAGGLLFLFNERSRLVGLPLMAIGVWEIFKYPGREQRWVKKKEQELKFNKDIEFEILNDSLVVTYDEESTVHRFEDMRKCLISETGILFKITLLEYYYISFNSLQADSPKEELIANLFDGFDKKKISRKTKP